jgi:Mce-associated membrane protein
VADKDVKVTEMPPDEDAALVAGATTAAKRAGPTGPAQAGKSDLVQSEIAEPEKGLPEAATKPEKGLPEAPAEPEKGLPEAPAESGETTPSGRPGWRIAAALGAATVVLAGFGVWATLHASSLRSNSAAQANTALTDGPVTATVRREISTAVNTIFSYNYADTAATRRAAQAVLTGPAVRQYNTLFALVTKNAPAQKLVVTTRVTNSGLELLNGDRARLLVFANQQDTRAGTGQTSYAGAMFAVTALHQGGRWKIENIDTFSG